MAENIINGKTEINRLFEKSSPKSDALISFAAFELQKGHACPASANGRTKINSNAFIYEIYE